MCKILQSEEKKEVVERWLMPVEIEGERMRYLKHEIKSNLYS
jgi:hypothetical protein